MQYILTDLFLIVLGFLWVAGFSLACEQAYRPCQIYAAIICFIIGGTWTVFRIVVMGLRIFYRLQKGEWID